MDINEFALASFVIIGFINGVQFAVQKKWDSFTFFSVALFAGTLFGYLRWFGLPSAEVGLALGIASSGVYKVSQNLRSVINVSKEEV